MLLALVLLAGAVAFAWTGAGRQVVYPVSYAAHVNDSAERRGLDPRLVCAVIKCESGWDATAVSGAGAVGLMQVMPATADSLVALGLVDADAYSPDDLTDPAVNIEYGCAYLAFLEKNLSSQEEVVAAYNAGIGTVQQWVADGTELPEGIRYAETRAYLTRVQEAYAGYQDAYPNGI